MRALAPLCDLAFLDERSPTVTTALCRMYGNPSNCARLTCGHYSYGAFFVMSLLALETGIDVLCTQSHPQEVGLTCVLKRITIRFFGTEVQAIASVGPVIFLL